MQFVSNVHVINPSRWFAGYVNLHSADLSGMRIDLAGDISGLFDGDVKLQSVIGLDDWYNEIGAATDAAIDEANKTLPSDKQLVKDDTIITSFENLFKDNTLLRELETLENWDVSTVTNMAGMFWGAATLNDISQLNNWTTAQVTTMENMFRGMLKLRKVDAVVNWDTSSCANFDGMFQDWQDRRFRWTSRAPTGPRMRPSSPTAVAPTVCRPLTCSRAWMPSSSST